MACTKEELRKRIESTPAGSGGRLMFSPELRRDIVTYSKEAQATRGGSLRSIAEELGLNGWTLARWHQNEKKGPKGVSFVEVVAPTKSKKAAQVLAEPAAEFEVTCPSGFEVRVPARFAAGALRELLSVLEGR